MLKLNYQVRLEMILMKKALTSHKNFYNSKSINKLVPYKLIKSDYDITAFFGQSKEVPANRPTHYRKKQVSKD